MSVEESIREEFRRWQREHPNFITPELLEFEVIDKYVVELSKGEGIKHEPLYGVSLLSRINKNDFSTRVGYDVSSAFWKLEKAKNYFDDVVDAVQKCKVYENEEEFKDCVKKEIHS